MAFGLSKSRISPIAIDFGADSLKMLQVTEDDPPHIIAAAHAVVPEHARLEPAARQAFYAESMKNLLRTHPFRGKKAICSIPAYQTLIQHLPVSRNEADDLEEQVRALLRQRLNINPSRMVIRAFPVGEAVHDGSTKLEVVCMAASRDVVMRHIETVNRFKLDVVGMHCEPLTIIRAFSHLYRRQADDQRTTCFIDIGAATTKVVVAHGTELAFAKTIHAAGEHLTREYAKAHNLGFDDAREVRMANAKVKPRPEGTEAPAQPASNEGGEEISLTPSRRTSGASGTTALADQPAAAAVVGDMVDPIDCLIDELQLCVRYHGTVFADRPIEKLVFLGGESRHASNCQRIARALRIGAQLGDPLARLTRPTSVKGQVGVDLREPQPGWAVPIGLCLSEANL